MTSDPLSISKDTRQGCPLSLPIDFCNGDRTPCRGNHPLSSSMQVGTIVHKICLYAADIIVVMTNPTWSQPALHDLLQVLAKTSLYKINCSKSCMLDICRPRPYYKANYITRVPFSLGAGFLSHLGIQRAVPSYNTLHINLEKLLGKPKDLCSTMVLVKTSWAGKMALKNVPHATYSLPFPHLTNYLFGLSHNHNPECLFPAFIWKQHTHSNKICWKGCTRYK